MLYFIGNVDSLNLIKLKGGLHWRVRLLIIKTFYIRGRVLVFQLLVLVDPEAACMSIAC